MFRPFTSPEITDEAISDRQSLYLQDPTTIESYHELYLHLCKSDHIHALEAPDGFIYNIDPDHPEQLIAIGARARTRGTSEFTCLADVIAPEAFSISNTEGEGENDFIHTLHLPYCTSLAPDCFDGLCHIIQIDAPNLAEERALKYLLSIMDKYKEEIDKADLPTSAPTKKTPKAPKLSRTRKTTKKP